MSDPRNRSGDKSQRGLGAFLMACGALAFLLCGLCSVAFLSPFDHDPHTDQFGMLGIVAIFGGVPMLSGAIVFFVGLYLYRRR